MARKPQKPIDVISYVRRQNGEKVRVDELNEAERCKVADQLRTIWFNELYKGVAVFRVADVAQREYECRVVVP